MTLHTNKIQVWNKYAICVLPIRSLYHKGKWFSPLTQTMIEEYKIGRQFFYWCLSKNFSITTENAANPAQPAHAAFGPPTTTRKLKKRSSISWWNNGRKQIYKTSRIEDFNSWFAGSLSPLIFVYFSVFFIILLFIFAALNAQLSSAKRGKMNEIKRDV